MDLAIETCITSFLIDNKGKVTSIAPSRWQQKMWINNINTMTTQKQVGRQKNLRSGHQYTHFLPQTSNRNGQGNKKSRIWTLTNKNYAIQEAMTSIMEKWTGDRKLTEVKAETLPSEEKILWWQTSHQWLIAWIFIVYWIKTRFIT